MEPGPPAPATGDLSEPAPAADDRDADTEVTDVAADLASLEEIERQLIDVDAALRHLDDGTYGICETCGTVIDEAVLVTSPVTRRCARCAPPTAGTLFAPG